MTVLPRLLNILGFSLYIFWMSVSFDTTKDLSLFKRETAVPESRLAALRSSDPGIPITRCISVFYYCAVNAQRPAALIGLFIFLADSSLNCIGSPCNIFILVLPSEIFHTALEKAFYFSSKPFFLFRNIDYIISLCLDVLYL